MDTVPPEKEDFYVDLPFSGPEKRYFRPIAFIVASITIAFVIATMTTEIASLVLPMSDDYLQALVPVAPDGAEPLSLRTLEHEITDNTIIVRGAVTNRTDYIVSNILAVIEMQETTTRFAQTAEVPVEPPELAPQASGSFMATATLREKPAGYVITFRLMDGPFIPHKDDRAATFGISGK